MITGRQPNSRRRIVALMSLTVTALACQPAFCQEISHAEQAILAKVDAVSDEAIGLIQRAVDIESPTQNLAGVKQVGALFRAEFDAIGFTTRWADLPEAMKRGGHLVAELKGGQGKRLLLLGHIDTVLSGERFRREGNRAYGAGTVDMKAGNAVMLSALKALHVADALKDRQIIIVLTGDEEAVGSPTSVSRAEMVAAAKRSDYALSFEAGIANNATIGRRGSSSWTLEVTGDTGHSSGIFSAQRGVGAILEAARILNEFYESLHAEKYLTFNPSLIVGGSEGVEADGSSGKASGKKNVIPNRVMVTGDLRFLSEEQKESARARMRDIAGRNLPKTSAKITFTDGIPAMTPTDGNRALLARLDQVSRDLGFGEMKPGDPGERGAGDIAFVSHLLPSLDGLGARGGNSHAPGEWVELDSLPMQIKRAAILIYRLTR